MRSGRFDLRAFAPFVVARDSHSRRRSIDGGTPEAVVVLAILPALGMSRVPGTDERVIVAWADGWDEPQA